jgi:hypothetical protein
LYPAIPETKLFLVGRDRAVTEKVEPKQGMRENVADAVSSLFR